MGKNGAREYQDQPAPISRAGPNCLHQNRHIRSSKTPSSHLFPFRPSYRTRDFRKLITFAPEVWVGNVDFAFCWNDGRPRSRLVTFLGAFYRRILQGHGLDWKAHWAITIEPGTFPVVAMCCSWPLIYPLNFKDLQVFPRIFTVSPTLLIE